MRDKKPVEGISTSREPIRLKVGVDFGTTHSGIAYADTRSHELQADNVVKLIKRFPGSGKESCKVPSRVAYRSENSDSVRPPLPVNDREVLWGHEVQAGWKQYTWFKLRLDQDARITQFDDRSLGSLSQSNEGIMQLPEGKGPTTVCEEYLVGLHSVLDSRLRGEWGDVIDEMPIDFVVTVPAIWGDPAKRYTKTAAKRAGFGKRDKDSMILISEPEAAATFALSIHSGCQLRDHIQKGQGLMIVDLGGGTADVTTYLVTEMEPEFRFRELVVGDGGKVGSTAVNRAFHDFCSEKLGPVYQDLPAHKTGPGSTFMMAFEDMKHSFEGHDGYETDYEVPLYLRGKSSCQNYDDENRAVQFSSSDMQAFFTPSVDKIVKLLRSQTRKARAAIPEDGTLKLCVFVGGYSESPYLQSVLRRECRALALQPCFPYEPQASIVKGAVLRGLGGIRPDARCCRRHYGFAIAKPFRERIDPEYLAFIHEYHDAKYCRGRMSWLIEKGDTVDQFTTIERDIEWMYGKARTAEATYKLYGCSKDTAGKYITHTGVEQVGEIVVDFGRCNLRNFESKEVDGERIWRIKFNLEISLGNEDGLLRVRALVGGREIAEAKLNFNDLEASLTDTTPALTAPGAPKRRLPTASRPAPASRTVAAPRSNAVPRARVIPKVRATGSYTIRRSGSTAFGSESSSSTASGSTSPRKKRKTLKMDHNEISKAEDSE